MQRLSRIETAVIAAGIDNTNRLYPDPVPEGRRGQTHALGRAMLTRTKLLDNLARYDGRLSRRFFRGVELMINIRREDRQLREAFEAKNAGATTPVHYLPDEDPSSTHPPAIGFRPAEKLGHAAQWGRSPDLPGDQEKNPRAAKKGRPTTPQNQKLQNEPKTNLTSYITTRYESIPANLTTRTTSRQ